MPNGRGGHPAEVLVGVDCSPRSAAALRFAVHEAELRDTRLVVLMSAAAPGRRAGQPLPTGAVESAEHLLSCYCREIGTASVDVQPVVTTVPAERALVDRSGQADLLVLGTPRVGWSPPTVPAICLRRARCPVAVVHPDSELDRDPGPDDDDNAARYL